MLLVGQCQRQQQRTAVVFGIIGGNRGFVVPFHLLQGQRHRVGHPVFQPVQYPGRGPDAFSQLPEVVSLFLSSRQAACLLQRHSADFQHVCRAVILQKGHRQPIDPFGQHVGVIAGQRSRRTVVEHIFDSVLKIIRPLRQGIKQAYQHLPQIFACHHKVHQKPVLPGILPQVAGQQRINVLILPVHQSRVEGGILRSPHRVLLIGNLPLKMQPPEGIVQIVAQNGIFPSRLRPAAIVPFFRQAQLCQLVQLGKMYKGPVV